jgi:hypothetical protein
MIRNEPRDSLVRLFPPAIAGGPPSYPPVVRVLSSVFLPEPDGKPAGVARRFAAGVAMRAFGLKQTNPEGAKRDS